MIVKNIVDVLLWILIVMVFVVVILLVRFFFFFLFFFFFGWGKRKGRLIFFLGGVVGKRRWGGCECPGQCGDQCNCKRINRECDPMLCHLTKSLSFNSFFTNW